MSTTAVVTVLLLFWLPPTQPNQDPTPILNHMVFPSREACIKMEKATDAVFQQMKAQDYALVCQPLKPVSDAEDDTTPAPAPAPLKPGEDSD